MGKVALGRGGNLLPHSGGPGDETEIMQGSEGSLVGLVARKRISRRGEK